MKKLVLILILLIFPLLGLADAPAKNCYENYTAIRCGSQQILSAEQYCPNISIEVRQCRGDGENITIVFSGIESFRITNESSDLVFGFYSRNWAWAGKTLPENSTITINRTDYVVRTSFKDRKIESVQITVPFCYNKLDQEGKKLYPRTQAGKTCSVSKAAEKTGVEDIIRENESANATFNPNKTKKEYNERAINENWVLAAIALIAIIAGYFALKEKRKR